MEGKKRKMSEFAIASLVMGVLSLITLMGIEKAIVAIIFGILALKRIYREEGQLSGKNLAVAGLVLGAFSILFTMIFIIKFFPKIKEEAMQMQSQYKDGAPNSEPQAELIPGSR